MYHMPLFKHLPAAASALIELIQKESDNNVKLIVLDRVDVLRGKHEHVLDGLVLDILAVLTRCATYNCLLLYNKRYTLARIWKFGGKHSLSHSQ